MAKKQDNEKKKEEKSILAIKIKTMRKKAHLTQEEVSNAIGVNRSAYAYYEIGTTTPRPETIHKIAKLYNISSDDLFSEDNFDSAQIKDMIGKDLPLLDINFNDLSEIERLLVMKVRLMSSSQLKELVETLNNIK